ncbi:MAG TPA: hypothetical protein VHO50_06890 [Bacteroidales bacterium]|nr:hypothetical protein [Bacteroidales bacterium]
MNKKFGISSSILFVSCLFILVVGCKSGNNSPVTEEISVPSTGNEAIYADISKADKIFSALPSPLESAQLIKSAGAKFDEKQMNSLDNVDKYVTTKSMALNLGVYTCDLSFASMYEQTQLIVDYMSAAKKMADGLGILDAISEETINRLEENINNKEEILNAVSETFLNSNSYLEENGQPAVAAMVLVGGWFEGLYISTQLVDMNNFNGNKLVSSIIDQKLSIDLLINLLDGHKGNPAVDEIIAQVRKLKVVFDKISIKSSAVQTEYDESSNSTMIKSKVTTDMTPEVFKELMTTVTEIRSSFVKI